MFGRKEKTVIEANKLRKIYIHMDIKATNLAETDLFCALDFICVSRQSDAHHFGNA